MERDELVNLVNSRGLELDKEIHELSSCDLMQRVDDLEQLINVNSPREEVRAELLAVVNQTRFHLVFRKQEPLQACIAVYERLLQQGFSEWASRSDITGMLALYAAHEGRKDYALSVIDSLIVYLNGILSDGDTRVSQRLETIYGIKQRIVDDHPSIQQF